jgi:hypothetical protein
MNVQDLKNVAHLHHAYLVVGDPSVGKEQTLQMLEARGIQTKGNPDVLALSFPELLVDDVRDTILPFASLAPLGEHKYVVTSFSRANGSSQNALLKAVEDSLGRTVFFFSVDAVGYVLPTLRSRCITLNTEHSALNAETKEAGEFLKAKYSERLATVEKMVDYISKTQDRAPVREFVKALTVAAHTRKLPARALRDLLDASQYLRQNGSSAKAVLGHLAVSLLVG